jgi:hypothetical protein
MVIVEGVGIEQRVDWLSYRARFAGSSMAGGGAALKPVICSVNRY